MTEPSEACYHWVQRLLRFLDGITLRKEVFGFSDQRGAARQVSVRLYRPNADFAG
ncbi:MAG TPA: hypothetical protein VMY98_05505 [Anaerolineae bacterium]|nr:hypothetical protein [Anaerolineae bacterium]